MEENKTYIAIDLKSFYASVECRERNRDPLTTNLVVADPSRTEKTICLAVSPSLKAYGIPGRARLFEVVQKVREANNIRRRNIPDHHLPGHRMTARSWGQIRLFSWIILLLRRAWRFIWNTVHGSTTFI